MSAMAYAPDPEAQARSERARRANATTRRKAEEAQLEADVALLRGVYTDEKFDLFDRVILPYLIAAADGEPGGDLLGGAHSATAMVAAGLRVVSFDDLRLAMDKGLPRDRAQRAEQRIADEAGVEEFHVVPRDPKVPWWSQHDVLGRLSWFYFDGMGPLGPETPAAQFLRDAKKDGVRHVVVTYQASRNAISDVSNGEAEAHHMVAKQTAKDIGWGHIVQFRYRSGNIPMGVLLLCRCQCAAYRGAYNRYHQLTPDGKAARKAAQDRYLRTPKGKAMRKAAEDRKRDKRAAKKAAAA